MADVRLNIAGREYSVTCKDGEEDRLQALGKIVDAKAREAGGSAGGLNESRQLLFASLLLADQLHDALPPSADTATAAGETSENLAPLFERLAERLESLVQAIEKST